MPTPARPFPARGGALPWLTAAVLLANLGAVLVLSGAAVAAERTGTATDDVALRAGPHDKAAMLLTIPADTRVVIAGKPRDGYYPVDYAGLDGWIATGALADALDGRAEEGERRRAAAVAAEDLDLRAVAGRGEVLLVVPEDAIVELTGAHAGGFVEVRYEGTAGWAPGDGLVAAVVETPRQPEREAGPRVPASRRPTNYGYSQAEIIGFIEEAARRYGQSRKAMLRVARCESELTPTAVNPRTGDSGLFQFNPNTWLTTPYADEDIFDPRASALAAGWMWSVGRRNEWVCQ